MAAGSVRRPTGEVEKWSGVAESAMWVGPAHPSELHHVKGPAATGEARQFHSHYHQNFCSKKNKSLINI